MKKVRKKKYQEWCIDSLYYILIYIDLYDININDAGYKRVLTFLAKHYPSMYRYPSEGERKLYQNKWWDGINSKNYKTFFNELILTKDAYDFIKKNSVYNKSIIKNNLHFEHIFPTSYILKLLFACNQNSGICKKTIRDTLKMSKLVVITKKEKTYLDSKGYNKFSSNDYELCKKMFGNDYMYAAEDRKICDENKSSKNYGTPFLRIAHLLNQCKKVKFVDFDGKTRRTKDLYNYILCSDFVVKK